MPFYGNLTENMAMTPLEYWTLWLLNAVEIVAHLLLTCPFSAVNFLLIMRTSILHKNLKFILLSQSCSIFARSFFRIIIVGYRLGSGDLTWGMTWWLIFLFTYAAYFRNILAHVLVLERVWATMDFKKYEWSTRPYFTVAWMFFVNALTFTNCLGNSLSSLTTFFNLLIWAFLLVFAVLEVAVVAWLWRYNDRIYRTQCIVQATLSERYQLAENIRTAKQLFPVLLIHFFNILLGVYVNWTVFFRAYGPLETPRGMFTYELINQFYMTIVAATNFAIEFSMIMCHPYLKRNLLFALGSLRSALGRLCCCPAATFQRRRVGPSSVSIDAGGGDGTSSSKKMSLTSVRGQEMLASEGSEADEYFRQLRLLWERPKSKVAPAASSYCE